jgi:hypothetical protein
MLPVSVPESHVPAPPLLCAPQVFSELVKGLGESLVSGMVPGSSVAFAARKDNLDQPQTLSYASKSEGMFVRESLIFRCGGGVHLKLCMCSPACWQLATVWLEERRVGSS